MQDKRTNINWKDKQTGSTPLHVAASKNHVRMMAALLQRVDVRPNEKDVRSSRFSRDCDGWTPLACPSTVTAERCQCVVCASLWQSRGRSPFWLAASLGRTEAVRLLLSTLEIKVEEPNVSRRLVTHCTSWLTHFACCVRAVLPCFLVIPIGTLLTRESLSIIA